MGKTLVNEQDTEFIERIIEELRKYTGPEIEKHIARLSSRIGRCPCGAVLTPESRSGPYEDLCPECWSLAGEEMAQLSMELGFPERANEFRSEEHGKP